MASTTLFNDATLSDVKIIQVHDGKKREYHAHKAVLCSQSTYFMKAFTGRFKEAGEGTMKLEGDDPIHFEYALKFMYTLDYNIDAIEANTGNNDKVKRVKFSMGVYKVADKYDIKHLLQPIIDDIQNYLEEALDVKTLVSVLSAHYDDIPGYGHSLSKLFAKALFQFHHDFTESDEFLRLCEKYPAFAIDAMNTLTRQRCTACGKTVIVHTSHRNPGTTFTMRCPYCHRPNTYIAS